MRCGPRRDAIAFDTTAGIPEHKMPEVALVTAGVEHDVTRREAARVRAPELLRDHQRLQAEHLILLRPRPNGNDRASRSRAREPFSTLPVLGRSFGSVAEQRTTNASRDAS